MSLKSLLDKADKPDIANGAGKDKKKDIKKPVNKPATSPEVEAKTEVPPKSEGTKKKKRKKIGLIEKKNKSDVISVRFDERDFENVQTIKDNLSEEIYKTFDRTKIIKAALIMAANTKPSIFLKYIKEVF